jgi:hypothetical protein
MIRIEAPPSGRFEMPMLPPWASMISWLKESPIPPPDSFVE